MTSLRYCDDPDTCIWTPLACRVAYISPGSRREEKNQVIKLRPFVKEIGAFQITVLDYASYALGRNREASDKRKSKVVI